MKIIFTNSDDLILNLLNVLPSDDNIFVISSSQEPAFQDMNKRSKKCGKVGDLLVCMSYL